MNHKKPSKNLIESISQVVNEKLSTNNVSTNTLSNVAHMGDGTSLVDSPPPTKVGKIPVGKGKRVGLGWVSTPKDFKVITDIIKDAGIKIDDADDPRDVLKALNQAKYENQKKLADDLANKFNTSIGRPEDAISDVKQAIIQYDKAKAEFSKHTEKIADKIHKINKGVIEKRWKNPDLFNKDNASKYVAWDIKDTGEEHETQRQGQGNRGHHRRERQKTPAFQLKKVPLKHKDPTTGPPLGPVFPTWGDDDAYRRKLMANKPGQKVINVGLPGSGVGTEWWNPSDNPDDINVGMPGDPNNPLYYGGQQGDGNPQGQQAPTGRDARIKNVQDTIQTRKLEKQGVYTPQSKNKVGKKLIKDAMTRHPEKGEPTFVISKGSKDYDEIIKKYGTELENNNGEYETAEAGIKEWYPYGFRTTEGYRGYLLRRYARKPGFKITPKGTLTTVGKGVAGGLGIVIIVGGVAIYYSHTVASDETAPENIPGFGDINPGEHVPYDPTPGVIPVGYGDSPSIGFMGMPGTGWGPGESPY